MMKKILVFLSTFLLISLATFAQYATINYDLERNFFNEGQPLVSEKSLMFTGVVPENVKVIEITILPGKAKSDKDLLYQTSWIDVDNSNDNSFSLAINYQLRSSGTYDFRIDYYSTLRGGEKGDLSRQVIAQIKSYLEAYVIIKGRQIELAKSEKKMAADMEDIVTNALAEYRTRDGKSFGGFSQTIEQGLINLGKMSFVKKDTSSNQAEAKRNVVDQQIGRLQKIVEAEIVQILDKDWNKRVLSRYVDDQETEKRKGALSINVGYGGVYLGGDFDDFSYGSSPYLGLSFPLANSTLAPKFLRNSSLTLGAFLQDFEDADGNEVTGFLVGTPTYLGLDYKLFEFIRFNAGATFLEKEKASNPTGGDNITNSLLVRPFIGLSARIDLSVRLGK